MKQDSIFKQEVKRDIGTFKRLKGRKKLQFIWDYFRFKIIAAIFIVFVLIIAVSLLYDGQRPRRLRVCAVLNTEDLCHSWFDDFFEKLQADGKKGLCELNEDQPFDYTNKYYYLHEVEVMTTISSQRMDVAICGPDMYSYVLAINACMPLDKVLPADKVQELKDRGMLVESTAGIKMNKDGSEDDSEAVTGYFAIDISNTAFGKEYNENQKLEKGEEKAPLYALIISNTKHVDDSVKLLEEISK